MNELRTYGFADEHSTLICYRACRDAQHAESIAADMADDRNAPIEYWLAERDENGALPNSRTAWPRSTQ